MKRLILLLVLLWGCVSNKEQGMEQMVWHVDNLKMIGGHAVDVVGQPAVIDTPEGKAVEFDGVDDGLFFDVHPMAGWEIFTAEVIFKPYPDGPKEQRFFHMQEQNSTKRVLFETRLTDDHQWFIDTFIQSGDNNYTMYAQDFKHPIGPWYHAAIVVDGKTFKHYVNGQLELSKDIVFVPHEPGRTSLGVRINQVYWFKGAIRTARFTHGVLTPDQFLKP
jgi:hypothetical protein